MTICPCCGFKFHGSLADGCTACGAYSVGQALPRPAHELPSYGRSLALVVSGSVIVLVFVTQTIIAMAQRSSGAHGRLFQFWQWVAAGETAAWRLKWISIPVMFVTLWAGLKIYRSIKAQPQRFCGVNYARRSLLASATVALLIATLIGITVPARMRQRDMAIKAGIMSDYYTVDAALTAYQIKYKTYPADLRELTSRIPDPNGRLAAALNTYDPAGYHPSADVAAVAPTEEARTLRGAVIRKASFSAATDDAAPNGIAFTNYELRLPGEDKILGTDDDWIARDGVIMKLSDVAKGGVGRSVSAGVLNQ
ncbi:MAG TPA: hypothetical protein VI306_07220 [Pyrinomonadaceae bacterium]